MLPYNNHLLRKIGTNKTKVLHRMRLRQFTRRQSPDDIRVTPQEWKPNPEVSLKHDDLYARDWGCEYEQPFVDAENKMQRHPIYPKFLYSLIYQLKKRGKTPGTAHDCSPESFPQTEDLRDVANTYFGMEHDLETSSERPNSSLANHFSSNYNTHHNPKPNCNDDYRFQFVS